MPKKILFLSDYGNGCMTGYATVSRNIIARLKACFEDELHIDVVAVNYFGPAYKEYNDTVSVVSGKLAQNRIGVPEEFKDGDNFGRLHFAELYNLNFYDGIFILMDLGTIAPVVPWFKHADWIKQRKAAPAAFSKPPSIIYFPVDGKIHECVERENFNENDIKGYPKEVQTFYTKQIRQLDELDYFTAAVTFTQYGQDQVELQKLAGRNPVSKNIRAVIPHGINTSEFFPVDQAEKKKFRDHYFGKNAGKYIIGVINRNQPRKDIPTAIFGFLEAKNNWNKNLPAPFLYLHMDAVDPKGWNLHKLLAQTGLMEGKDYMFSKGDKNGQVPVQMLNSIYNSIDVFLSTALGGGWELTVTEAMACKVPCIIPEHTSMKELGADGRAFMLDEFVPACEVSDNVMRLRCHYQQVSELIKEACFMRATGDDKKMIEGAYAWVTKLTWENVCDEWINLFSAVYGVEIK